MDFAALRRLWPLTAVALLLGLAAVAAAHSSLRFTRVERPIEEVPALPDYAEPPTAPTASPQAVAAAEQTELPDWIATAAIALCVAAVIVVMALVLRATLRDLLRRRDRARSARSSATRTAADVVAALDAGLVDLSDSDADPRRAVIACWVRLEQAAAAAGTPRKIGDTPTDLVTRLLSGHGPDGGPAVVSAEVLAAFAHVYREARYATHAVDERMRAQARTALQRLRTELTAGAAS
ncbi:protein of unknown function [Micromonospora pattaloongensis]|uniref:Protein-glutamine gamma-glutamyltransferase-like C-terminal domain-containing protein n=1 Tax=Micromonospora pattaloongensis TaxID=405436 RepID=A0A1H3MA73_9ACTN|nr:DUF4129 domain-containing protein [Micromonospora pattaloongensis]SDY73620.1 protein of unknown function [Micromonospora pattaloongensis]